MKKIFLFGLLVTLISQSFAQTSVKIVPLAPGSLLNSNYGESKPLPSSAVAKPFITGRTRSAETVIGVTSYDNQPSNQRLFSGPNGTLSATWTGSQWTGNPQSDPFWPDRGTFYAYFNGTSWDTTGAGRRLEGTTRTGFPGNVILSNGNEWVCSHIPDDTMLGYLTRPVAGNGSWTFSGPQSNLSVMWPKAVASGNTIHLIGITDKNNTSGYLHYFRSSDGGHTWDNVPIRLPQEDTANCIFYNTPDNYAIDARGNTVAIVAGGVTNSLYLWKSTDNGNNWTRSMIADYSVCEGLLSKHITDSNDDGKADSINATDGDYALLIDKDNTVHVWFGDLLIKRGDTSSTFTYYYHRSYLGLRYWNDKGITNDFKLVAHYSKDDSDGIAFNTVSYTGVGVTGGVLLSSTVSSMPTASIDTTTGYLYCVFSQAVPFSDPTGAPHPSNPLEPVDTGAHSLRDLFGIYSADGGANWSPPINLTNSALGDNPSENVFPAAGKYTRGGAVDVIWMRDGYPGCFVLTPYTNPLGLSQIVYRSFSFDDFSGVNNIAGVSKQNLNAYPNPSSDIINLNLTGLNSKGTITITDIFGQTIKAYTNVQLNSNVQIKGSDLANGLYVVKVATTSGTLTGKVTIAH